MEIFLGLDPGTKNFAYGVVQVRGERYRILQHGMLQNPMYELKGLDVGRRIARFKNEIMGIRRRHQIEFATAERFMTRGHGGTTIEAVSLMLGVVATIFRTNIYFVTAAGWKNAWNKHYDLKRFYSEMKPYRVQTHQVDAVSLALYGATTVLQKPHFAMLSNIRKLKTELVKNQLRAR